MVIAHGVRTPNYSVNIVETTVVNMSSDVDRSSPVTLTPRLRRVAPAKLVRRQTFGLGRAGQYLINCRVVEHPCVVLLHCLDVNDWVRLRPPLQPAASGLTWRFRVGLGDEPLRIVSAVETKRFIDSTRLIGRQPIRVSANARHRVLAPMGAVETWNHWPIDPCPDWLIKKRLPMPGQVARLCVVDELLEAEGVRRPYLFEDSLGHVENICRRRGL